MCNKLACNWTVLAAVVVLGNCGLNPPPKDDDGSPSPVPRDDGTPSAVPIPKDDETPSPVPSNDGTLSAVPIPKDDETPSPVPRDDGTPSAVPIPKDDEILGVISIPKGDDKLSPAAEDDVVVEVEDTGIEKFSVGCELLALAVDGAFGRAKLNICEVLPVALPTSEGIVGTVKLSLVTAEDASAGLLVSLANAGTGNTIEGC